MGDAPASFDAAALDALKAIGKTLGQMSLYRVGHPSVKATLADAHRLVAEVLQASPEGELTFSIDNGKLIGNGRVIGVEAAVPNAIVSLFSRFRLRSIAFKAGLTDTELASLCELAGLRQEQAKGTDAAAFLSERGVGHIRLNEAIYAKVENEGETQVSSAAGAAAAPAAEAPAVPKVSLAEKIAGLTIEQSIDALTRAAATDGKEQSLLYRTVIEQLQADLENRVRRATESLRREKTQVENEHVRTQAVLSTMAEGVVVVDDQGKVLMMNPAAEELYGVKLTEVAGTSLAEHVKDQHLMTMAAEISAPQDRPIQKDVAVSGNDDTRRTVRASTALVQNESGKPVGMVSVLTDVTKHKELERMEREFIAHVTHELRAPLSSIRASLEILFAQLGGKLGDEDSRIFTTALRNADRLEDLIRSILDFSKIESGQMTVHPRAVPSEKLASDSVDSLKPWCKKKGIQLSLTADPGLPEVDADPQRTVQVVINLLSNAIKFTPSGGRIDVRVVAGKGENDKFAVYSVTDTGPGIAKKDHEKIFEKFVQIAAGEKHVGGTGLGLSIAKALIHMQRGRLWLESDLGKGATFYFTLPFHVAQESGPAAPAPAPRPWWKRLLGIR